MVVHSKRILLLHLLIAARCCVGAPLGMNQYKPSRKNLEETTNKPPIRILRTTDEDVIIQIFRPPFQLSSKEDIQDDGLFFERSDESTANKHVKSKLKFSGESQNTGSNNGNVNKDFMRNHVVQLTNTALQSFFGNSRRNKPTFWDKENNNYDRRFNKNSKNNYLSDQNLRREPIRKHHNEEKENEENGTKPKIRDINYENGIAEQQSEADLKWKGRKFLDEGSQPVEEGGGKVQVSKEPNEKDTNEVKRTETIIHKKLKTTKEPVIDDKASSIRQVAMTIKKIDQVATETATNSVTKTNKREAMSMLRRRNDNNDSKFQSSFTPLPREERSEFVKSFKTRQTPIEENGKSNQLDINSLNNIHHEILLEEKEPLQDKIIQIRSPQYDTLQDFKRKLQRGPERIPILPPPPGLLGTQIMPPGLLGGKNMPPSLLDVRNIPPLLYGPPTPQYHLPRSPILVGPPPLPPTDPVADAANAQTNLQRMILFVNALGKVDYYVSNAAKNLVGLLTQHTNDYDRTVRSRIAASEGCLSKTVENDDNGIDNDRVEIIRNRDPNIDRDREEYNRYDDTNLRYRKNSPPW